MNMKTDRYQPCPARECGLPVDTWLAGTTAAHRTAIGVMHAGCWLDLDDDERREANQKETA